MLGVLPAKLASAGDSVPVAAAMPEPAAKPRSGGWMIQVGAFDDESEAKQRLIAAQGKAKDQLGQADPFTERVAKGDKRSIARALPAWTRIRRKPPASISSAAKFHACC